MNIEALTISNIREINALMSGKNLSDKNDLFVVGQAYLIRTVTMMYTGRLERLTDRTIELKDAAWIADSGRYSDALKTGSLDEVEPYPDAAFVNRDAIVDYAVWSHPLPREQQ